MSMNKTNGYEETLSPYSYSMSGLSKIQSDVPNVTITQTDGHSMGLDFHYGTDVVTVSTTGTDGMWTAFGGIRINYPANATITASDWVSGSTTTRLTTTIGEYLRGESSQGYYRPAAPGQLSYHWKASLSGNETPELSAYFVVEDNPSSGTCLAYIRDSDMSLTWGAYFEDVEYNYNVLNPLTSTQSFRVTIEGVAEGSATGSCRMVWSNTVEKPSFFKASLLENRWLSNPVTSGGTTYLTVKNPFKLSYSGYAAITQSGDSVIGLNITHTGSANDNTQDSWTLSPSSKSDTLAIQPGLNRWGSEYNVYEYIEYSIPTGVTYLKNAYIVNAYSQSSSLTINCNDNFVTDFTNATISHNTPSTSSTIENLYVDKEKTNVTVSFVGTRIPYYDNITSSTPIYFEVVFASGDTKQYITGISTTFSNILANGTISGDYIILNDSYIWRFTTQINLNLSYSETAQPLAITLSTRWLYNTSNYARGIRTDSGLTIYPYRIPQVTAYDGYRYRSGGTSSYVKDEINGTIAGVYSTFSCTPIGNNNIFTVNNIKARATDASTYIWTTNISSGTRVYIADPALDIGKSYIILLTLTDSVYSTVTMELTIAAGTCFLDFKTGGLGMAIGKASEKNGLEVNFSTDFYDDVTFGTSVSPVDVDFTNANVIGLSSGGDITVGDGDTLLIDTGGTLDVQGTITGITQSMSIPYTVASNQNFLFIITQYNDTFSYFTLDGRAPFARNSYSGINAVYTYNFLMPSYISLPITSSFYFLNVTPTALQTGGITNNALIPTYAVAYRHSTQTQYLVMTVGMTSNITLSGDPTFPANIDFSIHFSGLIPIMN